MIFKSNSLYDVFKWCFSVVLPALAALYFGLAGIWGLPYAEQICGTIAAVVAFGDALLGISSIQYQKTLPPHEGTITFIAHEDDED